MPNMGISLTNNIGTTMNNRYSVIKGESMIGRFYDGHAKFLRTTDTSTLEKVPAPFSPFQIWLGRFIAQMRK